MPVMANTDYPGLFGLVVGLGRWHDTHSIFWSIFFFFKQKTAYEIHLTGVQTCALPILGNPVDPNQQAAEEARNETLKVLAEAKTFDELTEGVTLIYKKRRPRHGHEAAQLLNFIEIRRSEERRVGKECA